MQQTGRPDIKDMCPYIQVYDMPESIRFYREILGFNVAQTSGDGDDSDWILLQLDGMELMLNTIYEKQDRPPQRDASRIHRDTAFYFSCPDIDGMYAYLAAKGLSLKPPFSTCYGFKAIYLEDPDGYGLWFHWPATP